MAVAIVDVTAGLGVDAEEIHGMIDEMIVMIAVVAVTSNNINILTTTILLLYLK